MRRLAWTIWAVSCALAAAGAALVLINRDVPVPDNWGFRGFNDISGPLFATAGLLIVRRHSRNAIGWILLVAGLSQGFNGIVQEYAIQAVIVGPDSLPGAIPLAWVASWSFAVFMGPVLNMLPQLFPTGRPISPRWRPLLWAGPAFIAGAIFIFGFRPGQLENATFLVNPLGFTGALADLRAALEPPLGLMMASGGLVSVGSLAVRFRRASGVEREQLKWILSSVALCGIAFAVMLASGEGKLSQIAMFAAYETLPVAIVVAMLRYHLYDIDLVINRALVYATTTAALAIAFFGGIVVLQGILRPLTGGSEVAVAASTLACLALFQPLRTRVQRAVDRRFYRSRYDAVRTLDDFSVRLRDQVALDAVRSDLLDAVREAVQPVHASVWLRERVR